MNWNARRAVDEAMQLGLTDEEAAALLTELSRIIQDDRYSFSRRIRLLRDIRKKLPSAPLPPRRRDHRHPRSVIRGGGHGKVGAVARRSS
jgi:hypothetical protein